MSVLTSETRVNRGEADAPARRRRHSVGRSLGRGRRSRSDRLPLRRDRALPTGRVLLLHRLGAVPSNPAEPGSESENYVSRCSQGPAGAAAVRTLFIAVVVVVHAERDSGPRVWRSCSTVKVFGRNVLRTIIFAPLVVSALVVGYLFKYIFGPPDIGGINIALDALGLPQVDFLGNPTTALWIIILTIVWQFTGSTMVIYLAGLQGVPPELLEAAALDGAGFWKRFWFVMRPLLAPAITINLMLGLIGGLKIFDQIFSLTGGGPAGQTQTISTLIYQLFAQFGEYGKSAALAMVLAVAVGDPGLHPVLGTSSTGAVLMKSSRGVSVATHTLSYGTTLVFLLPVYILINLAIRPVDDFTTPLIPSSRATLDNFVNAWTQSSLPSAIITSIIVTTLSCVAVVALATMAAYPLARSTAKLSNRDVLRLPYRAPPSVPAGIAALVHADARHRAAGKYLVAGDHLHRRADAFLDLPDHHIPSLERATGLRGSSSHRRMRKRARLVARGRARAATRPGNLPHPHRRRHLERLLHAPHLPGGEHAADHPDVHLSSTSASTRATGRSSSPRLVISMLPILVIYLIFQRYVIHGFAGGLKG